MVCYNTIMFSFETIQEDSKTKARRGVIHTPHGDIETPAFVPVGTQATVKTLSPDELSTLGVQLFFVNTYHVYLRPGIEVISQFNGLHAFMNWSKPLITDSGGFQVFSLARGRFAGDGSDGEKSAVLAKIREDGVEFQSHWDGSSHFFTPEKSMDLQWALGSDIHIAFDDCTAYPVTFEEAKRSMERTHRWARRSLLRHLELKDKNPDKPYQALYGSVQGSVYKDLRKNSATYISSMPFDGIAVGGVSVGESKKQMADVLGWVTPELPIDKPKHLLGVGEVDDIFALVEHGFDTFDCVQPTRLGRMGHVYDKESIHVDEERFTYDILKQQWKSDTSPLGKGCICYTCRHFSRAYIHHLFKVKELLGYRLVTIHNVHFIQSLVACIRDAIVQGTFLELKHKWLYNK